MKTERQSETTKSHFEQWMDRLEACGVLRNELSSLGWAFWPKDQNNKQMGFFDENSLRQLADEIERRNKPFWEEYEKYYLEHQDDLLESVAGLNDLDFIDVPNTNE